MARDNLVSEWDSRTGNYIGVYTALGTSVTGVYANNQSAASHAVPPWVNSSGFGQGGDMPWLEIKRTGYVVTTYCSLDGSDGSYTQVQQVDYSTSPWGPTMYLGLDLINTTQLVGDSSGDFDTVNFMGTAGSADMTTTEFALNGGAKLSPGLVMTVNKVSTNGVALPTGCWGATGSGANNIDDVDFTGTGIAVIAMPIPLTITGTADITIASTDSGGAVVFYPDPVVGGGIPPYTTNVDWPSGTAFPLGNTTVTWSATDSACPAGRTVYASFKVSVLPPPELPLSGFSMPGGTPTFDIPTSVVGFQYRVVYKNNLSDPAWTPVDGTWTVANGGGLQFTDPSTPLPGERFYRIEVSVAP